jgi:hypothetical protein
MLLSDGPADEYDHLRVLITEVSLLPASAGAAPVVIFRSGGHWVDLLEYREEDYLLTIKKEVPAGRYAKIRLKVEDIEAVPKQNSAAPCSGIEIKLPGGKIDLNPREPFFVSPGGTLSIRLDIDANKSINLHQAGRSGKCIFRPVVFVDVKEGIPAGRCPKVLSGTISQMTLNGANQVVGFSLDLQGSRGTIEVGVQEKTPVFNRLGECVTPGVLKAGDDVKVRGKLVSGGVFEASFVVMGQLLDVAGTVIGAPVFNGSAYTFTLEPFEGQELVGQIPVQGQACTLTLVGCDTSVGPENLKAGMTVRVFGKLVIDGQGSALRAAAITLRNREIEGEITSVAAVSGGKEVSLREAGGGLVPVFIPHGAPIYLEGDGPVPIDLLCPGQTVRVLLDPAVSAPLTAALVRVQSEGHNGMITSIDVPARTLTVDLGGGLTEKVFVEPGAVILKNREDFQELKGFGDLRVNDYIAYFGLSGCGSEQPFHAFVIVIGDPQP